MLIIELLKAGIIWYSQTGMSNISVYSDTVIMDEPIYIKIKIKIPGKAILIHIILYFYTFKLLNKYV